MKTRIFTLFTLAFTLTLRAQFVGVPFTGTNYTGYEAWPTSQTAWPLWQAWRAAATNNDALIRLLPDAGLGISYAHRTNFTYTNFVTVPSTNLVILTNLPSVANFAGATWWSVTNNPAVLVSTNSGTNWHWGTNFVATLPAWLAVTNVAATNESTLSNLVVSCWVWPIARPTNTIDTTWGQSAMVRWDSNTLYIATGVNKWGMADLRSPESLPRWVDAVASGLTLAANAAAPTKTVLSGFAAVPAVGYAYAQGDSSSFDIQTQHVLASTNAAFPHFYYEPHVHISSQAIGSGTNATFVCEWQTGLVFGTYTNWTALVRTNTYGFSKVDEHGLLSFGYVTNDALAGASSLVFRGGVMRIASPANDVGTSVGARVFVDSLDFHVPARVNGSRTIYSGE